MVSVVLFILQLSAGSATAPSLGNGEVELAPGFAAWFKGDAIVGLNDGDPIGLWEDSSSNNKISPRPVAGSTATATSPNWLGQPSPGYAAWFKADAIVGLNDGAPVASWEDSSPNNKDATQSSASFKPVYKSNIVAGKPVVRFDGTNDRLVSPGGSGIWGLTNHFTVFAVVRLDSLPGSGSQDVVGSSAISNNLDLIARRSDGGGNWLAYSSSPDGVRNSTLVLSTGTWHLLTWRLPVKSHPVLRSLETSTFTHRGW